MDTNVRVTSGYLDAREKMEQIAETDDKVGIAALFEEDERILLIALWSPSMNYTLVLDVVTHPLIVQNSDLQRILTSSTLLKIMHNSGRVASAFLSQYGIELRNVLDISIGFSLREGLPTSEVTQLDAIQQAYNHTNPYQNVVSADDWQHRPLAVNCLQCMDRNVQSLMHVNEGLQADLTAPQRSEWRSASQRSVSSVSRLRQAHNQRRRSVQSTADDFFAYLVSLEESELETIEASRAALNECFTQWKAATGHRGGLMDVISRLAGDGRAYRNGDMVLFETSPGRIATRRGDQSNIQSNHSVDADRAGVEVSERIMVSGEDGALVISAGERLEEAIHIVNRGTLPIRLQHISLTQSHADAFSVPQSESITIPPNGTLSIALVFSPIDIGMHRLAMHFQFDGFAIARYVNVQCGDSVMDALLRPTAPYQRPHVSRADVVLRHRRIYGGRPPQSSKRGDYKKIAKHAVPLHLRQAFDFGDIGDHLQRKLEVFRGDMSLEAYADLYHYLLWAEELKCETEIQAYGMDSATLTTAGEYLQLVVPGLAEKRPSLLVGDTVLVSRSGEAYAEAFEGYVHAVEQTTVKLLFAPRFHKKHRNGTPYKVEFQFPRMTMRLLHQALGLLSLREWRDFLFPQSDLQTGEIGDLRNVIPFNRYLNNEQKRAVQYILAGRGEEAPYVIFGPPGTGKTVTVVEAIKQLHKQNPQSRILVTAPSNAAVNVLVARLLTSFNPTEMFHFVAFNHDPASIPAPAMPYCKRDEQGFIMPPLQQFLSYRIVISTCAMASKLHNYGVEKEHFHAVFIDECGHCWEPESIASIAGTMRHGGQVIVSGDPMQLGPVTHSSAASEHGLGTSLIERLLNYSLYKRDSESFSETNGYDPLYVTKLIHCYRCHPEIIRLPNQLFYNSDLIPSADHIVSHNLVHWSGLPHAGFPLIFHGLEGENTREENSPSWFNVSEVEKVLEYILQLQSTTRVLLTDIGVITPYHKQTIKIKQALRSRRLDGVTVGSCEQFQGQERRVIIISTVRSTTGDLIEDKKHNLGFVADAKRFNVAITRAQALLIVIGSPTVLCTDNNWRLFIEHCAVNGGSVGVPPPPRMQEDLQDALDALHITGDDDFEIVDPNAL